LPKATVCQGGCDTLGRAVQPVAFVAYSDYLCPWCYNAAVRLRGLVATDPGVRVEWRSYLLRPRPGERRDLERFRAYTRSWRRPAAEPDAGRFQVWQGEAGPPSHSVPPQLVAKAAARLSTEAFERLHERLFEAYFAENRDVTDARVLRALWAEAGLPAQRFGDSEDPELLRQVVGEHEEAVALGATGVPSLRLADDDVVITGALPLATVRRWVERTRAARGGDPAGAGT
jgi:predicted DsbA family dithiol-disulfide isomerase